MSFYSDNQTRYIATLAGIAGLILVIGFWLKPAEAPEPTISQAETSLLRRLTQRSGLTDVAGYIADLAGRVQGSVVWIEEESVSGLIWRPDGLVVTTGPVAGIPEVAALTVGGRVPLSTLPEQSGGIVAAMQAPVTFGLQTPKRRTTTAIPAGTWVFQVGREPGGGYHFTQAAIGGMARVTCDGIPYDAVESTLPLDEASLGSGVFDLDENLLGMVIRCGSGYAAVIPEGIDQALQRAVTVPSKLNRFYGLTASDLTGEAAAYFGRTAGAWISAVTVGLTPTELATGDVIVAIDNRAVNNVEGLAPLFTRQDRRFTVALLRSGRRMEVSLRPALSSTPATGTQAGGPGIVFSTPEAGLLIERLEEGSLGSRAGLKAGDRLISINGTQPNNIADAQTRLRRLAGSSSGEPALLIYQRGNVRTGVWLP